MFEERKLTSTNIFKICNFFFLSISLVYLLRRQFFVCLKESETYTRRQREEGWRRRDTYDVTLVEIFVFICSSSAANENSKKWIVFTCIYKWLKTVFFAPIFTVAARLPSFLELRKNDMKNKHNRPSSRLVFGALSKEKFLQFKYFARWKSCAKCPYWVERTISQRESSIIHILILFPSNDVGKVLL